MVKGWNRKIRSTMAISRAKTMVLKISPVSLAADAFLPRSPGVLA